MPITLDTDQIAIQRHPSADHGRVLAGPGTGKSTATVALAERLLAEEDPPRLRFLTFTRAATAELGRKLEEGRVRVRPSTIHSFALSILVRNPGCANYPIPLRIPDAYEQNRLVYADLARRCRIHKTRLRKRIIREMAARWESLDPNYRRRDVHDEERARFHGHWNEHRKIFGYSLLSELPSLLRDALVAHADLEGAEYDLMLVDEYQDLNACDLAVIRLLAERGSAVMAVGDDEQSIFSFRMAHPAGIRMFPDEYTGARDYQLRVCHRLSRRILEWAQFAISGAPDRIPRAPLTCSDHAPEGDAALLTFGRETTEARGIAQLVKWLCEVRGVPASEILILTRSDHNRNFSRPIRGELESVGIPVSDPGNIKVLLAERQNRLLVETLRLVVHPEDSLAWWALIDLEPGLGEGFVANLYERAKEARVPFGRAFCEGAVEGFAGLRWSRAATRLWRRISAMLDEVRLPVVGTDERWGAAIVRQVEAGRLPTCTDELCELLLSLDDVVEDELKLGRFLSSVQPLGEDLAREHSEGVRIMTMSGSKGLTVRATIVAGVDSDLIPRPDCDPDEERRLLYVAMTRSREYLFLTWASRRQGPTARAAGSDAGRRTYCEFLRGGPVDQVWGDRYLERLPR